MIERGPAQHAGLHSTEGNFFEYFTNNNKKQRTKQDKYKNASCTKHHTHTLNKTPPTHTLHNAHTPSHPSTLSHTHTHPQWPIS